MNLRALWANVRRWYDTHSVRDRRIILGVAVAAGLSLVYVAVIDPIAGYRKGVAEEIAEGQEQLERAARFLGALDSLRAERDDLRKRLEQAKTHLLPGDSGTLGAAALQERANAIANEKGITVQSTQVMKEEPAEPFRKVAVRLTLSGELKPFADFVAGLEYGPQQLKIPFFEVSRRGAVPNAKGPRTLTSTVEVSGYLLGAEHKAAEPEPAEGEGEGEAQAPGEGEPAAGGVPAGEGAPGTGAAGEGAPAAGPAGEGPPVVGPAAKSPPVAGAPEGPPAEIPRVEGPPAPPPATADVGPAPTPAPAPAAPGAPALPNAPTPAPGAPNSAAPAPAAPAKPAPPAGAT